MSNDDKENVIFGQHHLRNLLVRPQHKSKGCPLALTATYKPNVSHNFDTGPLVSSVVSLQLFDRTNLSANHCLLNSRTIQVEDILIIIRNRLLETDVQFEFDIDQQPGIDFSGTTCFNWSLKGGGEISVPLKVLIYSGGVYNLQSVRLTVLKTGVSVPYLFPLQWTMVAEDRA